MFWLININPEKQKKIELFDFVATERIICLMSYSLVEARCEYVSVSIALAIIPFVSVDNSSLCRNIVT